MSKFTVFDVETPNRYNNRISAIGITVIEDGVITDDYYSLVNPETGFDYFNIQLTGIDEESVCDAPSFPEVWREIEPIMSRGMIVAHNAVFDLGVLQHGLQDYGIDGRPYTRYI
ncbi:MAG: exonuclease, partial [Clostridia bacterium]|nr:exonuclease [Clostridia bacterium]